MLGATTYRLEAVDQPARLKAEVVPGKNEEYDQR
jgi:hypothetical protein